MTERKTGASVNTAPATTPVVETHERRRAGTVLTTAAALVFAGAALFEGGMLYNNSQKPSITTDGQNNGQSVDTGAPRTSSASAGLGETPTPLPYASPSASLAELDQNPKAVVIGSWAERSDGGLYNVEVDASAPGTQVIAELWFKDGAPDAEYWIRMDGENGTDRVRAHFLGVRGGIADQWNTNNLTAVNADIALSKAQRETEDNGNKHVDYYSSYAAFVAAHPTWTVRDAGVNQ